MRKSTKTDSLTTALKTAITESGLTLYRIARDTGVQKPSLIRFMRGETSLRLDKAGLLAAYLGLRLVPDPDAKAPQPTPENLAGPLLKKRKTK
jgi:transcriptional regulator with XRE-family HTH domain